MHGRRLLLIGAALLALAAPSAAGATAPSGHHHPAPEAHLLASGLEGASGSTVGPDGALYVTEGTLGRVSRVDPVTGAVTTFATGLPTRVVPAGGAVDVVFRGWTAYVLVTIVGADVGGDDVVGVYRIDGPTTATPIADVGAFSLANPPTTDFFVPTGAQYSIGAYRDGLLVVDAHHNRLLQVGLDGTITEVLTLGNVVPTEVEVTGRTVLLALAGPVPHLPEDGRLVSVRLPHGTMQEVAAGAPLLVAVERGPGGAVYVLSNGDFREGDPEGAPALPDTGALLRVGADGTFDVVVDGLDRPTSLEIEGRTAFVVTVDGEVWRIDGLGAPGHHGR